MTEYTDPGFPASEPLENQGLQEPKIILTKSPRELRFEQVNEVTVKLTDGKGSLVPACHGHWSGYQTTRAVAWLMGIGNGSMDCPLSQQSIATDEASGCEEIRAGDGEGHSSRPSD